MQIMYRHSIFNIGWLNKQQQQNRCPWPPAVDIDRVEADVLDLWHLNIYEVKTDVCNLWHLNLDGFKYSGSVLKYIDAILLQKF